MPGYGALCRFYSRIPRGDTQAETLDELNLKSREVVEMLLEDGEPVLDAEFIGTQNVTVA